MPYRSDYGSSYQVHKDVLLSRVFVPASYTFIGGSNSPVSADSNGNKLLYAGQVVSVDAASGKAYPHTVGFSAQSVVGVLIEDLDLRYGDEAGTIIVQGWVDENLCIDLDVFGTVGAAAKTALADRVNFTKRGL